MTETLLSSASREVCIGFDRPFVIIGERINPTGREILAEEMKNGDYQPVAHGSDTGRIGGGCDDGQRPGLPAMDQQVSRAKRRWWGARSSWSRAPSPNDE